MKVEWCCINCDHYECISRRCLHRCGPNTALPDNPGCRYFELNGQVKRMNKYEDMSIDNMIEKMEELEKRNEALDKRATELVKSVEEKDERADELKNNLVYMDGRIRELEAILSERHATNRELAKNCVRLETENREKDEQIEKLKKDNDFFRNSICNEADLRIRIGNLSKLVTEKNKRIEELETWNKNLESDCKHYENEQLNNRSRIASLDRDNEQLLKDFGEAAKEVEEKRTLIIKLENENREKEAKIASLTQELADKKNQIWRLNDDVEALLTEKNDRIKELEDQLDRKSDVCNEQKDKIEDLQKKLDSLIERNKALKWVLRELYPETFVTRYLGRPMGYDDGTSKICYKCCPEIKKLIDDAKERLEHDERVFRSTETFNLDISSLYPKKFDLNPNADCPAYAARMKAKYDNLRAVGFTEDQTMSLLPLWTDE